MRIDLERALGSIAGAAESAASPVPVDRVLEACGLHELFQRV